MEKIQKGLFCVKYFYQDTQRANDLITLGFKGKEKQCSVEEQNFVFSSFFGLCNNFLNYHFANLIDDINTYKIEKIYWL